MGQTDGSVARSLMDTGHHFKAAPAAGRTEIVRASVIKGELVELF